MTAFSKQPDKHTLEMDEYVDFENQHWFLLPSSKGNGASVSCWCGGQATLNDEVVVQIKDSISVE